MKTQVLNVEVETKVPLRATLLIPETLSTYRFRGKPASFTGGAREHEFPLGAELEFASQQAFSQVFQRVDLARARPDPQNTEILIEPEIIDFHFRYDQLSYAGFAIAAVSRVRAKVTMSDGTTAVWTHTAESPEERSGPWAFDPKAEEHTGKAASLALAAALRAIASEAAKAPELRKLADRIRTERGPLQP